MKAKNLPYPITEQAVNKTNYIIVKTTYLICNTNSTLNNMYDQSM